ncbi:uncharacterized protein LOC116852754 [Odontomachus brunneus]|uniref:uncharacterized protein LOC116852754 n=1 Tax=Odontomachus brunneus TaxID=486640 RepID=UPI0013F18FCC|nr:uncharacterized protein LOC116852754 [Odontomachus brunneus]
MYLLPQLPKHPLLRPTLSSKSKNAVATRYDLLNWCQVGKIEKLHVYPLLAGHEIYCPKCSFTETGMTGMFNDTKYSSHMFVIYDCKTNYIIHNNAMIANMSIKYLGKYKVRIRSYYERDLIIETNKVIITGEKVTCTTSFCQKVVTEIKCKDCGPEAATWISKCIKDDDARLACTMTIYDNYSKTSSQKKYQQLPSWQSDNRNITTPSASSPFYTLIPCPLRNQFNFNVIRAIERRIFKPHIYVKTSHIHDIHEWNWIMIGNVILRNIKQLPRSRRKINWQEMPVQKFRRFLPLQYELTIPGQADVGDYVYIKKSNTKITNRKIIIHTTAKPIASSKLSTTSRYAILKQHIWTTPMCLGDKDARLAYHALEKPKPKTPYWKLCQRLHSAQQDEKFYGAELDERFYEKEIRKQFKLTVILISRVRATIMNLYKLLTYLAFFKKQKFQSNVNINFSLTLWEHIQGLICKFACVINQLISTSDYESIFTIKRRNVRRETNWHKVGDVINLYTYPLFAASEEEISKCSLNHSGLIGINDDSELRNHMFIVYNSETKYIIHDCDNYILRDIKVINVDNNKVILQSFHTHYVMLLDINKISIKNSVKCVTTFCNQFLTYINCIDCGLEAADWISNSLKDSNLRLGYTIPCKQTMQTPLWKHIQQKICGKKQDEKIVTLSSSHLPICTLVPSSLRGWIGNRLMNLINSRDFRPNIVISTNSLHDLIEWEWIMVGNAVLRNFRPWRSRQTKLDGRNMPVNMMLHLLPLRCKLYCSGQVRIGDGVYVKMPTKEN